MSEIKYTLFDQIAIELLMGDSETTKRAHKIVLLGRSGVGKTSLLVRWIKGEYDELLTPTFGACALSKDVNLNGKEVSVVLWDTAGQEKFQAMTPFYSKNSACAILVADISEIESFNVLGEWVNRLNVSCERVPPVLLAVNKIDKTEAHAYSDDEIYDRFRSDFQEIYFVSARTNEGVDDLFMGAAVAAHKFDSHFASQKGIVHLNQTNTENNKCSC